MILERANGDCVNDLSVAAAAAAAAAVHEQSADDDELTIARQVNYLMFEMNWLNDCYLTADVHGGNEYELHKKNLHLHHLNTNDATAAAAAVAAAGQLLPVVDANGTDDEMKSYCTLSCHSTVVAAAAAADPVSRVN